MLSFLPRGHFQKFLWVMLHIMWPHGQKVFFSKILKSYGLFERPQKIERFSKKTVVPENKQVLSYKKLKFLWIQWVIEWGKTVSFCFFLGTCL